MGVTRLLALAAMAVVGGGIAAGAAPAQELALDIAFVRPTVARAGPVELRWRITNVGQRPLAVFSHVDTEEAPHYDAITLVLAGPARSAATEIQLSGARKAAAVVRCVLAPGEILARAADVRPWLPRRLAAGQYTVVARFDVAAAVPVEHTFASCRHAQADAVKADTWIGSITSQPVTLEVRE
jgi:hypothetical protein